MATHDPAVTDAERARRRTHPTARRLVAAARDVLVTRGFAGTTWEAVERAADVSTGTLRYYYGSKERLLEDVLRADSDARLEELRARAEPAQSVEEIEQALADMLEQLLTGGGFIVLQELGTPSLRDEGLRRARDELRTRFRDTLAELLERKTEQGVVALPATPAAVAGLLAIIGQGIGAEATSSPTWDPAPTVELARRAARQLLTPPASSPPPAAATATPRPLARSRTPRASRDDPRAAPAPAARPPSSGATADRGARASLPAVRSVAASSATPASTATAAAGA